jgi:hypothetical protein
MEREGQEKNIGEKATLGWIIKEVACPLLGIVGS